MTAAQEKDYAEFKELEKWVDELAADPRLLLIALNNMHARFKESAHKAQYDAAAHICSALVRDRIKTHGSGPLSFTEPVYVPRFAELSKAEKC